MLGKLAFFAFFALLLPPTLSPFQIPRNNSYPFPVPFQEGTIPLSISGKKKNKKLILKGSTTDWPLKRGYSRGKRGRGRVGGAKTAKNARRASSSDISGKYPENL